MSCSEFYLVICAIALAYNLKLSIAENKEIDRMALLDVKAKIIHDPFGVMSSWNNTLHICQWQGVTCGRRHRRVTELDLHSSNLTGTLSPYLGNLSFLRVLLIQNNSFIGPIPPQIGRMHRLQYIAMDRNHLTGNIPSSLGNLSSLSNFYAVENSLNGSIPHSLGNLKSLTEISLPGNKLSGEIPPSIFNLSLLTLLDLGNNDLEGNLPFDLGNTLPRLRWFSVAINRFTGRIPVSISNSSNLQLLQLNQNQFYGQVPSLQKLSQLTTLNLYSNSLGNEEHGDLNFVPSLANATMLQSFSIGENNFTGVFPETICNFSMLTIMSLDNNNIVGGIPNCIESLVNLQAFAASDNGLSGTIPRGIGKLKNLNYLQLDNNQLTGDIPPSIGNLSKLSMLTLYNNNLDGQIPSTIGGCKSLVGLYLSHNNLSGMIPVELFRLSTLSMGLNLGSNRLSGSLPEEVGLLYNLEGLDISRNMLSGKIPSSLGSCIALEVLEMGGNYFKGLIPSELRTLKGLVELDLSQNNLSGEIPNFLASLQLQRLNLSYNSLEGEVPVGGVFNYAANLSITGNDGLCGGIPDMKLPRCNFSRSDHKRRSKHRFKSVATIISGVLGFVSLVVLLVVYMFRYRKRTKEPKAFNDTEIFQILSYQTLVKATNNFCVENLLGRGTFGVVYKGILDQDGSTIAVKIFNLEYHGASKTFMAECRVLRSIRHRNLVKIITACSSVDYQGRNFKALFYEFMVNGSLEDWLHPTEESSSNVDINNSPKNLNLRQRLNIAVDVAFALEYLHHDCGTSIVHCDLKPSNILLDEEIIAHVSDFGLAKFIYTEMSNSHGNQSSSLGVRGTIGYAPPEYGVGNEVSTSGDVYSFGIILLEMFTGKSPTNDMFKEGLSLHDLVKGALPQQITKILDHALLEDIDDEEQQIKRDVIIEALISILGIALSCSTEIPRERLNMSEVAAKLSSIRNKLLGTRLQQRRLQASK